MSVFKPAGPHNSLQAPGICLCVNCCRIVATLRCPARDDQGRQCGDYRHRSNEHSLIPCTEFQIADERLAAVDTPTTDEPAGSSET